PRCGRQHLAELGRRAVEVAELLQIDLAERSPGQHFGVPALSRRPAQDPDGLLRVRSPQFKRGLPDVIDDAHVATVSTIPKWGVQGGARSPLVEAAEPPDLEGNG